MTNKITDPKVGVKRLEILSDGTTKSSVGKEKKKISIDVGLDNNGSEAVKFRKLHHIRNIETSQKSSSL